jgi:hypothetical protein
LRAETLGRQSGNVPWALDRILDAKTPEQDRVAIDTRFGTMMVHEIRWWDARRQDRARYELMTGFGYGREDCQVFNYWDANHPVKADDTEAKTLLLKRGQALLLLVCTWNPNPSIVRFKFDCRGLGVKPTAAVWAEHQSVLAARRADIEKAQTTRDAQSRRVENA